MNSLVMSRLLQNVHTWVMSPKALAQLNGVYMRVLRRIADRVRFDASCDSKDLEVRQMLSQPSNDCLVQRKRLLYLCRLAVNRPKALWAILQSTPNKKQLPWTAQVVADLQVLYANVGAARVNLPAPSDDGQAWLKFLIGKPTKWHQLVDSLFYTHSVLDRQHVEAHVAPLAFSCHMCPHPRPMFSTPKGLAQHKRIKNKMRTSLRWFVDDSGVCPCCKNIYHTRIRVLTHLSNPKKPECKEHVLYSGNCAALPCDVVQKLDAMDKIAIREARKQGHSHPRVTKPALRSDGACIGCARA